MAAHEALLRRFKPRLLYDSNEAFFADSAAEWTDNPGNVLRRLGEHGGAGEVIAAATPQTGPERLSLEFLGYPTYANGVPYQDGDAIGDPSRDYRDQYVRLRQQSAYRNRIYGRAKEDSDGRLWLQYWFFYFYNDRHMAGNIGLHEGDWEMAQLRLHGEEPDLAVYAQHRWAERRSWDEVERQEGSRDTPLVYVARGSHASYFSAGYQETEAWYDMADGKRPGPEPALELIDDGAPGWASWPGRWGDTRPRLPGIEDWSPVGPCAHEQWDDPKYLLEHSRAPVRRGAAPPPEVAVSRRHARLQLDYDFARRAGPEPEKLIVTVNSVDDRLPPRTFTFTVEGAVRGMIETRLGLSDDQHYDVYVSTTDAGGRPSESRLTLLEPVGRDEPRGIPVLPAIGRLVAFLRGAFGRGRASRR